MKRRAFLLAIPALPVTFGASAQPPPGKVVRVGFILTTSPVSEMQGPKPVHGAVRTFLQEMRRLGYAEGRNFILERRSAEGKFERFSEIVAEMLRLKADAIITLSIPLTREAKKLTTSVPIVFVIAGGDPVAAGIVPSLGRPAGNITGFLSDAGAEISGKRVQYLKEAAPGISRIAYLGLASEWDSPHRRSARQAAQGLAATMFLAEVTPGAYAKAFEVIKRERADAIFTADHPVHFANRRLTVDFALRHRLPDTHAYSAAVAEGGLMSYNSVSLWPAVAEYVDRIVRGTKPGDLPVLQPTRFELVVNLKTARALGIRIPQSVLLRADRVIE